MKKILHVYPKLNIGGTEKVIETIIAQLNKKYTFQILIEENGSGEEVFKNLGIPIIKIPKQDQYWKLVEQFLKKEKFDIVHVHNYKDMGNFQKVAKKSSIKIRISHSHVARPSSKIIKFLKRIKSYKTEKYSTHFVACSKEAAQWLFQRNYQKSIILKNGIVKNKFTFDEQKRKEKREELALNSCFVIGSIARISEEKNHFFFIEVLKELTEKKKNIVWLVIGDGPLLKELKEKAKEYHLENSIIFLGSIINVQDYYHAFDLFVLPSKYEGLGISAVESQYNGLITLVSDSVPESVDIKENILERLSLNKELWVQKILEYEKNYSRKKINSKEFDIKENIKVLERIYDL